MHAPRDDFERELYDDPPGRIGRLTPMWQLLGLAGVLYLFAASLALYLQFVVPGTAGASSITGSGGLLVTMASGILAGWILIVGHRLYDRFRWWGTIE